MYDDTTVTRIGEPSAENAYMLVYRSTCETQRSAPGPPQAPTRVHPPTALPLAQPLTRQVASMARPPTRPVTCSCSQPRNFGSSG
jgi:hypothetical protein